GRIGGRRGDVPGNNERQFRLTPRLLPRRRRRRQSQVPGPWSGHRRLGIVLPRQGCGPLSSRRRDERAMKSFDAIVIGGGLVGSAIAYGLANAGLKPALLDEGDVAYRASRGNFGLVWVQSKGLGAPHYQRWTRRSAEEWPVLAAELGERTGISVGLQQPGGLQLCLGDEEFGGRRRVVEA